MARSEPNLDRLIGMLEDFNRAVIEQSFSRLIRSAAQRSGGRAGGLVMIDGLYPCIPCENIKALMDAVSRCAIYDP